MMTRNPRIATNHPCGLAQYAGSAPPHHNCKITPGRPGHSPGVPPACPRDRPFAVRSQAASVRSTKTPQPR